jgi:hypothetical protein
MGLITQGSSQYTSIYLILTLTANRHRSRRVMLVISQHHALATLHLERILTLIVQEVGGSRGRSAWVGESLDQTAFKQSTVQHVASRNTNYALLPACMTKFNCKFTVYYGLVGTNFI